MRYWVIFLFFFSTIYSLEEATIKRIHSHLLIEDYKTAFSECQKALDLYPDSERVKKAYIEVLTHYQKEDEALAFWKESGLGKKLDNHEVIENIAWGILRHSKHSSQFIVNMASLMSAFYTDDVRAVKMILDQLHSTNAVLRAMAAQLSSHYRDAMLIEELKRMLKDEKVWFVRLEVIQALGSMEVKEIKEPLKKIACHSRVTAEEKAAATAALVSIYEDIDPIELKSLITSNRSGLRHLACQIVSHLDLKKYGKDIATLLDDPTSDVRIAALNTLYFLGMKNLDTTSLSKMIDLTLDSHPVVALTAAWATVRLAPENSLEVLKNHIYSTDDQSRRLAAYILGRVGKVGGQLSKNVMQITPDPFVKANLSLGMVGQGEDLTHAADVLYTFLMLRKGKVMWDMGLTPFFKVLAPSKICHVPQVPEYPTMVDHLTRVEILGTLAVLNHPRAEESIKQFLTHRVFGVSYAASTTILEEGGDEAIDILHDLLNEEEDNVRIQAALVLAISGGEVKAIEVLQEAYKTADRDMKVNILGALGHIGDSTSIPFLINQLEEPYQILKVVAASALIQCVYH